MALYTGQGIVYLISMVVGEGVKRTDKCRQEGAMNGFEPEKFKALVHYVCFKCDRMDLGATKLNKTLWFSDVWFYLNHGRPITGETYVKQKFGPVSSRIEMVIDELRRNGLIEVRDAAYFGYPKKEYIALKRPDLSLFSAEEISVVDMMIDGVCRKNTARSISEISHNQAWKLAEMGEEIPYYTVFSAPQAGITKADLEWAYQSMSEDVSANA